MADDTELDIRAVALLEPGIRQAHLNTSTAQRALQQAVANLTRADVSREDFRPVRLNKALTKALDEASPGMISVDLVQWIAL
jgi:hypothetical protein